MLIEDEWLFRFFQHRNLKSLSLKFRDKGEAFFRLLYVDAVQNKIGGTVETYNCVFKYHIDVVSSTPEDPKPKEYFASERYWYETIYPVFLNFQKSKGVDTPFDNVPKCYGILDQTKLVVSERVIVLENVKATGHVVWSNSNPLSREHLKIVLKAYAKLHATSVAMQEGEPEKFDMIISNVVPMLEEKRNAALEDDDKCAKYESVLVQLYKYFKLKRDVKPAKEEGFVLLEPPKRSDRFKKVIVHGDCWSNNFLSKFKNPQSETEPEDLVIVDWQMIQFRSPIYDISSFLFSYMSVMDVRVLKELLRFYYDQFCAHLKKINIPDTNTYYPYQQFEDEWKMFCKDGLDATICAYEKTKQGGRDSINLLSNSNRFYVKLENVVRYLKQSNLI